MNIEAIGLIAGACTSSASIPQMLKMIRTGKSDDLSLLCYTLLVAGCSMWALYGVGTGSRPIVITNTVALIPLGIIWMMIVINRLLLINERKRIKEELIK